MTYCSTLAKPLKKKVEAGESLEEIAKSLCGNTIKRPRQKVIRIIRELLGEDYLIEHADTLGYDPKKATRTKSASREPVERKILSGTLGSERPTKLVPRMAPAHTDEGVVEAVRSLVERFGLDAVAEALTFIEKQQPSQAFSEEKSRTKKDV